MKVSDEGISALAEASTAASSARNCVQAESLTICLPESLDEEGEVDAVDKSKPSNLPSLSFVDPVAIKDQENAKFKGVAKKKPHKLRILPALSGPVSTTILLPSFLTVICIFLCVQRFSYLISFLLHICFSLVRVKVLEIRWILWDRWL